MPYDIIAISVFVIIVIGFVVLAVTLKRRKKEEVKPIDYRTFFILGICWFPIGIVFMVINLPIGVAFLGTGVTFFIIGLANRDKWKEAQPLTSRQKNFIIGLVILGILVFLLNLGTFLLREYF